MPKMMLWNLERADRNFSRFIRNRDGRCMNPLCSNGLQHEAPTNVLECSHYWGRAVIIARFDPENCIALCHDCHSNWEYHKQGKYRDLMVRLLGTKKYNALKKRVENYKDKGIPHTTWAEEIKKCREFLTNGTS